MWLRVLARRLIVFAVTLLIIGFIGATMVRLAPGFGVDEQEMDSRLRGDSIQQLRREHAGEQNIARYYFGYIGGLFRGNLGYSRTLSRPIGDLLKERFPTTIRTMASGLFGGWALGLSAAISVAFARSRAYNLFLSVFSGLFLCLPASLLGLFMLFWGGTPGLAVALIVFPKVYQYTRNLLLEAYSRPHILGARSRGVSEKQVFWQHALPAALPQILALAGVSVSLAFGVTIPIEVVCDSPGVGQLAWQAALARDLPLLTILTIVVATVTLAANTAGSASRP